MKPARELLKSGRVSEPKYEPPLLSGYVREGAKNYRSGLRIKSAVDVENLCSCWESRSAGKICAHSVAVGLGFLNPPVAPVEPAVSNFSGGSTESRPTSPRFVAGETSDAVPTKLHVILPPNFAGAWQKGQVMIVVEAEVLGKRSLLSALKQQSPSPLSAPDGERKKRGDPSKSAASNNVIYAADDADLELIEGLRALPAIFESGMATLARDGFLRLLPALQNHPRVTFGKATRVTIAPAALRPELLVESRGDTGIAVRAKFWKRSRKIENENENEKEDDPPSQGYGVAGEEKALILWNATEAWVL